MKEKTQLIDMYSHLVVGFPPLRKKYWGEER